MRQLAVALVVKTQWCCYLVLQVRQVNLATNMVTTILGTGTAANAGDGGNAISASISNPSGLAVASNGDIYVSTT